MADDGERRGPGISPSAVVGALIAVLLAIFVFQNTHEVEVEVYLWDFSGPLWLVLLVSIAVGLIGLELIGTLWRARCR